MPQNVHAVGVIFEDTNGDVLVLRRHENSPEGKTWGLVGGNVDEGEDGFVAALRETTEEIGHVIPPDGLVFIKAYEWERDEMHLTFEVYKYKVSKSGVDIRLDTSENTEFMWAQPKDLRQRQDLMQGLYPILSDEYGT